MPSIGLKSLLEHFIFLNFLDPQTPRQERLLPINIRTIKFRIWDCTLSSLFSQNCKSVPKNMALENISGLLRIAPRALHIQNFPKPPSVPSPETPAASLWHCVPPDPPWEKILDPPLMWNKLNLHRYHNEYCWRLLYPDFADKGITRAYVNNWSQTWLIDYWLLIIDYWLLIIDT